MSGFKGTIAITALGILGLTGAARGQALQVGQAPPEFSVASPDGKRLFLKDMLAEGSPIFIYFISKADGVSSQASGYINRIVKAYTPSHVKWFGIINVQGDLAKSYQAEFNPPYEVLTDVELSSMQAFKASSSPTIVEINGDGKVMHEWQGLSGAMMKSLNRAVAAANGKRAVHFDFSALPSSTQFGQPFMRSPGGG